MVECIMAVQAALTSLAEGDAIQPLRPVMWWPPVASSIKTQ